jgi:hypothetical protein
VSHSFLDGECMCITLPQRLRVRWMRRSYCATRAGQRRSELPCPVVAVVAVARDNPSPDHHRPQDRTALEALLVRDGNVSDLGWVEQLSVR